MYVLLCVINVPIVFTHSVFLVFLPGLTYVCFVNCVFPSRPLSFFPLQAPWLNVSTLLFFKSILLRQIVSLCSTLVVFFFTKLIQLPMGAARAMISTIIDRV